MDDQRFDELTRRFAKASSRRHILRGLAGGGAAGLFALFGGDAAAKPGKPDRPGKPDNPGKPLDPGMPANPGTPCMPMDPASLCEGRCGSQTNNCGQLVDCGPCCTPHDPATICASQCGPVPDGCGGTVQCDPCCIPATCQPGYCGFIDDLCGGTLDCGPCCTPLDCTGQSGIIRNECGESLDCGCAPEDPMITCAGQCGSVLNNCYEAVDCGPCCGTCDGQCGTVSDGCGGTLECGPCCTPLDCTGQCGLITNECGESLDCGACCTPEDPATTCAGRCGNVYNNCNQLVNCGSCGSGCFVAGTLIAMADGTSKPIEWVAAGDEVLAYGGRANHVLAILHPVLGDRSLYALNGGSAFVTASHPFLTEEGWKAVDPDAARAEVPGLDIGRLTVGDMLVAAGVGTDEHPVRLDTLEGSPADPATPLYNLDVGGSNTYVAAGLIVHNKAGL